MNIPSEVVQCMEVLGGRKSSLRNVDLKQIGREWIPATKQEREALAWLLSPKHREELRKWYSQLSHLNSYADRFRQYLERCIGEPLPLKESENE